MLKSRKLTIKTPMRRQWRRSGFFLVNFKINIIINGFHATNIGRDLLLFLRLYLFHHYIRIRYTLQRYTKTLHLFLKYW